MDSQLFTLSKIFTERLFRIPDYQRGYAWTELQWKDFWNDIQQIEPGSNHYTGVLTLESVPIEDRHSWHEDSWIIDSRSYEPLYVVDGQQRLTTSILLIQTIIESVPDGEKLNYTSIDDIRKKFIFDSKDGGISRSYIFGYDKDNPSYEFLKTKIFQEFSSTSRSEETIYTNNLETAKKYFSDRISPLSKDQLEDLYKKVTQSLLFNIFTISDEVDVCVAFETMNNRGKPLSYLELLKNRLIYLSLKLPNPDYEKAKLRSSINDCWKAIYHSLGRNKAKPLDDDLFLGTHYLLYYLKPAQSQESDELLDDEMLYDPRVMRRRDHYIKLLQEIFVAKRISGVEEGDRIGLGEIYDYVQSLQIAVTAWYQIFNPSSVSDQGSSSIWLDKLDRMGTRGFLPVTLAVILKVEKDSERVAIFKAIERHVFTLSLMGYGHRFMDYTGFLREAILLYHGRITAKQLASKIADETNRFLETPAYKGEIKSNFRSRGYYGWPMIKYFLYEYNLDLQERSKTERRKIHWSEYNDRSSDHETIEHIYPQNGRAAYWANNFSGFTSKQREYLKNSLGNLVPLSQPKNSSLSNKPFPEKVEGKKDVVIGFRYGCYAENELAKESDWTPQHIRERGLKLLAFMEKRWALQLGDEKEKVTMLNLDFL